MVRAIVIRPVTAPGGDGPVNTAALEDAPEPRTDEGPVLVEVSWSGINYKDALALTGRPGVVRTPPLIGGIDLVGSVLESDDPRWRPGDDVLLNGTGLSETRNGGFTERARVPGDFLVRVPPGLTPARAAALGTAGYTAALCVLRLEREGVTSSADHPVLVTGATGGVGSIAVMLLSRVGHTVAASTGRVEEQSAYLRSLGAASIVPRDELLAEGRPLQSQRWAGAIDTVGGRVLATALSQTRYGGTVTACGLAGSPALPASVMPFILRAVTLAGVDSVSAPPAARRDAWERLARDIDGSALDALTTTVSLEGAVTAAGELLAGRSHGRIAVRVAD